MLSFDRTEKAGAKGAIDTVLVCMVDMQGRLMGKRFHVSNFIESGHEETHCCNYLLATDIEMATPGWLCLDLMGKGLWRLRHEAGPDTLRPVPWLEGTAIVFCDLIDHHTHEAGAPCAAPDAQGAGRARQGHGLHADDGNRAGVLPVREIFDDYPQVGLSRSGADPVTTLITPSSSPPRKST
jgi:hypothetical protein